MTLARFFTRSYDGTIVSAKMPHTPPWARVRTTDGLMLDGIVINTYYVDEETGGSNQRREPQRRNVVCDVLAVSTVPGMSMAFFPRVPIRLDRGYMHEGEIWIPRPCTRRIDPSSEDDLNALLGLDPMELDGETILLAFKDNSPLRPIIVGGQTHDRRDTGNDAKPIGERLAPRRADGFPRLTKHQGFVWGVDGAGNFQVDGRFAHDGTINADGTEPQPRQDGSAGAIHLWVQPGSRLVVHGPSGDEWRMEPDGTADFSAPKVKLGTGASEPVIKGIAYNEAHFAVDDAWLAQMNALSTTLSTVMTTVTPQAVAAPTSPLQVQHFAALAAVLQASLPLLIAAIETFKNQTAPAALSEDVTTR